MTFVPGASNGMRQRQPIRNILFWCLMVFLATVLWKLISQQPGNNGKLENAINYSDLMQEVDRKNVATAKIYTLQTTADVHGQLREPPDFFRVTIPKESVQSVTEQLRNQGATIEVVAGTSWTNFVINMLPFLLLLAVWIFLFKRRHPKPPQPTAQGGIENRPLG